MVICNINERRVGEITVLDLDGEMRAGGSHIALRDAIRGLLGEGRHLVLLNLAGLSGIDAGGLGELILSQADLNRGGGRLKLLRLTRALREMMTITKLLTIFDVYEDEAEALAGFDAHAVNLATVSKTARPGADETRVISYSRDNSKAAESNGGDAGPPESPRLPELFKTPPDDSRPARAGAVAQEVTLKC